MPETLKLVIQNQIELNFSYLSFIKNGGLFIPTDNAFQLGDEVHIDLNLPGHIEVDQVEGRVVWISPANSVYQVFPGIGVQFIGENAENIHDLIKSKIDNTMDTGGYAYGVGTSANV